MGMQKRERLKSVISGEAMHFGALDSTTVRVALLTGIFLLGCFESAVLRMPNLACVTWFPGLAALTAWIAYPLTAYRIFMGAIVLVTGLALMVTYCRRSRVRTTQSN
jgi:hypothetical protein